MDLLKTCPWPARSCEVIYTYSQLKKVLSLCLLLALLQKPFCSVCRRMAWVQWG